MARATGADIQIENGKFTRIHNNIMEAIYSVNFTAIELRCVLYLLRHTYGFQRKEHTISYNEFASGLKCSRRAAMRCLKSLEDANVVYSKDNGDKVAKTWGFNKYLEQWCQSSSDTAVTSDGDIDDTSLSDSSDTAVTTTSDTAVTTTSDTAVTLYKEKKEIKENNSGSGCEAPDDGFKEVTRFYETNIGTLTEYTKQELETLVSDYGGATIVMDAMRVAVQANKKSLRYTHGVLRNWHADGKNGNKAPGLLPQAVLPSTIPANVFDV